MYGDEPPDGIVGGVEVSVESQSSTLLAVPEGWFSWDFGIYGEEIQEESHSESAPLARVSLSWAKEAGELTIEGVRHRMYREGLASGDFVLEREGEQIVRADKPSSWSNRFEISYRGRRYELEKESTWRRKFVLVDEGRREVGKIEPEGPFTRRAVVDLPEELSLAVRAYLVWLCVILWKRESSAGGAVAAGGAGGGG